MAGCALRGNLFTEAGRLQRERALKSFILGVLITITDAVFLCPSPMHPFYDHRRLKAVSFSPSSSLLSSGRSARNHSRKAFSILARIIV